MDVKINTMLENSSLIHPFFHEDHKKRRRWIWWIVFIFILVLGLGYSFWYFWQKTNSSFLAETPLARLLKTTQEIKQTISLVPSLLGYERPKTYLFLFLNNQELRPGGGFIGSYGLVKFERGKLITFETSGSENLDWAAPEDFKIEPPVPIKDYLRQPYWYFRDSNWSPDFPQSAQKTIWFYRFEGGRDGSKIDGVIGLTTNVLKELIKIIGPITVGDKIFNAQNVIDELQYQVEFGFKEQGKTRAERKVLVGELGRAILSKIQNSAALKWKDFYLLAAQMFQEKQLMIFSTDAAIQSVLTRQNWAGEIKQATNDYLMVVDANLISLKSDPEVERKIGYQIRPEGNRWKAKVVISYQHHGESSWKVGRYRTYTRVYVPLGSQLINSEGFVETDRIKKGENLKAKPAVITEELGKTVFGGFLFVEPGQQKFLTLEYYLPDFIVSQIKNGLYTLFVQKQLGASAYGLTVDLDFGKKIRSQDGMVFHQETDLGVDREFNINFK